jgi:hypothetical protein
MVAIYIDKPYPNISELVKIHQDYLQSITEVMKSALLKEEKAKKPYIPSDDCSAFTQVTNNVNNNNKNKSKCTHISPYNQSSKRKPKVKVCLRCKSKDSPKKYCYRQII